MSMSNDILMIGGYYPADLYVDEISKLKMGQQLAAKNFEKSFSDGIFQATKVAPHFISAPYFPSFPHGSSLIFLKRKYLSSNGLTFAGISYINLPLIKNLFKYFSLRLEISKLLLSSKPRFVICSTLNLAQLAAVAHSKFGKSTLKIVVIMDLPIFPGDCSIIYKIYLKYVEWPAVRYILKKFNYFIVATKDISSLLGLPTDSVSELDGIYTPGLRELNSNLPPLVHEILAKATSPIILYSGSLDRRYGIKSLVDEFCNRIDINASLIICGSGPLQSYIENISCKNRRIIYAGVLSVEDLRQLQSSVDLLVNPRASSGNYNLYSFPSKTLEYMASGTPVLMNKLPCLSSQYDEFIYYCGDNENFIDAVARVLQIPISVRKIRSLSAKAFVLQNKTSRIQIERIFAEFPGNY